MINARRIAPAAQLALLFACPIAGAGALSDPAMEPPRIVTSPGTEYADANRKFQGIPGIERASNGRLWVLWYSGDTREGPQNYVVLVTSGDDGKTWSAPKLVIDPPGFVRAFDACLWDDPEGRMWLFWTQAAGHWDGRGGIWAMVTKDAASDRPHWSKPRRITYLNVAFGVRSWLLTTDHKRIAILYLVVITIMFFVGGAAATI